MKLALNDQNKQFQEVKISTLEALLAQMRSDFQESDKNYQLYIKTLKDTGNEHEKILKDLQNDLYQRGNAIRDLTNETESQKARVEHNLKEIDELKAIEFDRKISGL